MSEESGKEEAPFVMTRKQTQNLDETFLTAVLPLNEHEVKVASDEESK